MKHLLLLAAFILSCLVSYSQKEANIWYFGNKAGLNFNSGAPVALNNSAMSTNEGCASIADKSTGAILFYTDGSTVWNKNNVVMPNGTNLGGNYSSTQSSVVVPKPGSSTLFYIFTVDAQNGIYTNNNGRLNYSIVDMTQQGGLGNVTTIAQQLVTGMTEKIAAVNACDGGNIWVIGHKFNSNAFYAYLITPSGISAPVISNSGTIHADVGSGNNAETIGYMKCSPDGRKLVAAVYEQLNIVEIFDFNNATGIVSNPVKDINFPNVSGFDGPYGASFSPDNSRLYITLFGSSPTSSKLYQYNMLAGSGAAILASRTLIASTTVGYYGAVQIGPNGKIYVAKGGTPNLDVVNNPNGLGAACNFVSNGVVLASGTTSAFGLPDIIESFLVPSYLATLTYPSCNGNNTLSFTDNDVNGNIKVLWNFGDPSSGTADTSTLQNPSHTFSSTGSFTVKLFVSNDCGTDSFQQVINVGAPPVISAGPDITICPGSSAQLNLTGVPGGSSIIWTPATGLSCSNCANPVASPSGPMTYIVTVTDQGGCSGKDTIFVDVKSSIEAATSGDTSVCAGNGVQIFASGGSNYSWLPATGLSNPNIPDPIATPSVITTYTVTVSSGNCTGTASLTISVRDGITVSITPNGPTSFCQGGSVQLTASGGFTYQWSTGAKTNPITANTTGTYSVVGTDQSGCTGSASQSVNVSSGATITITPDGATSFCQGDSVLLHAGGGDTYIWSTNETINPISVKTTGTYSVVGTDGEGCTGSATIDITVYPNPRVTASATGNTAICEGGSVQICAGQNYSGYIWSPGGETGSCILAQNPAQYAVTVTDGNGCTGTSNTVTVTVALPPTVVITAGGPTTFCQGDSVTLTAGGADGYVWSPGGATTTSIVVKTAGTYSVTGTTVNGCSNVSNPITVTVDNIVISCTECNDSVVVVDQNVTIDFSTNPPTYTGDSDLKNFYTYDNSGSTKDLWNAIFNVGANKLLIKNGATISTTANGGYAPGIIIKGNCEMEVEDGGHIIVNSANRNAGNILIQIKGNITINGEVRNQINGTVGLPGWINIDSKCGNLEVGRTGLVADIGVDEGSRDITLLACGEGGQGCNGDSTAGSGDIIISGLVKNFGHAHTGNQMSNRPNIKVVAFNGAVTINANTVEPLYDEFQESGTRYDIYGGILSWARDNVRPGKIEVQAKHDITVNGHGTDPTGPVRKSFGAIAAITSRSDAPGGMLDIRSLEGNITGDNRAFDVSGRNRLSINFAHIGLYAKLNILLTRSGANNTFNPVVNASSPSVGDKGGVNELRSFSGSINIATNAMVSAMVPNGQGSVQGTNLLSTCTGVVNNGTVAPADQINGDDIGTCGKSSPDMLYTSCEDLGGQFNFLKGNFIESTLNPDQVKTPEWPEIIPFYLIHSRGLLSLRMDDSTEGNKTFQWYYNGQLINGANEQTYLPGATGLYSVKVTDAQGRQGIQSIDYISDNLVVSPNPARNELFLKAASLQESEGVTITVMNVIGEKMQSIQMPWNNNANISIKDLPAGIYFVQVTGESKKWIGKFVKE